MQTRITLIRHGETPWNVEGRWQGIAPIPLNASGIRQAQEAAPALKMAGIGQIVSSDLLRARQTAETIAEVLGVDIILTKEWREVNLGRWQGLTKAEIEAWDTEAFRQFEQSAYVDRVFPEGETHRHHVARTAQALQSTVDHFPASHTLVVTHGGSIRCAVYHLSGESIGLVVNCFLTRLVYDHDQQSWDILGLNQPPAAVKW
ncbi:MAG: histidine phosphatase family protein [Chloroflexi bacterium]|nr:histidine phosphatase family protein [Chloroflexota bacterium]